MNCTPYARQNNIGGAVFMNIYSYDTKLKVALAVNSLLAVIWQKLLHLISNVCNNGFILK